MRIGLVLSKPPGYSETFFTSKIKGLQKNGFSVVIYAQQEAAGFNLCDVKIAPKVHRFVLFQLLAMVGVLVSLLFKISIVIRFIRLERSEGTPTTTIIKRMYLNAHLLKANLDWVHFGFATMALGSECVPKAIGAKMAVSFRGFDINVYPVKNPGCYNKLWKHIDKVHSISYYLYEKAKRLGLQKNTPVAIITPAVDLENLPKPIQQKNRTIQILTVARLHWIKGLDVALDAMKLLEDRGVAFEYHIVGDGPTKDTERYTFQSYEYGLNTTVFFCGKLSHQETLAKLQTCDIYLQPSINEGFCNAVLEAQALGKLVITSNVGGLPENIKDGETGWLVPPQNAVVLANQIQEVMTLSEDKKQQVSRAAVTRVHKLFNIAQQQQEFVSFYNDGI